MSVIFLSLLLASVSADYFAQQPKIVSQDGNLLFYVPEHKNINLMTQGNGAVNINGVDLTQTAKISNKALDTLKQYETNFGGSMDKITRFEQMLDDGLMEKLMSISNGAKNIANASLPSPFLRNNIRRLNRRISGVQRSVRRLNTLLSLNECFSNPCKNGGSCWDLFNGFLCNCATGWEGPVCDRDVNECARFAGTDLGCQNGATCVNRQGSYECQCPSGWFGIHCARRSSDCSTSSSTELCGHGTCVNQYNDVGYKCICDQGWTTDGKTPICNTDVNECTMNHFPCSVNPRVLCINTPGSFTCGSCPMGYTGNGFYCEDINECLTDNGGCSLNPLVQCTNTLGARTCGICPAGYSGDGIQCSYQGVCNVNNGGCHPLATCSNIPNLSSTLVQCRCPSGYLRVGNGLGPNGCIRSLVPIPQESCTPNPCLHGICRQLGKRDYICNCYAAYAGRNCEKFRDVCTSDSCYNGGTCVSILGLSFKCVCPSSFSGLRCREQKQACGGRLLSTNGTLIYPGSQSQSYGNVISCAWSIETNKSSVLNITFKRFNIEESNACRYDWLQIHDGRNTLAPSVGRFCGHNLPKGGTIISTHPMMYLWFRSDHSVTADGFELSWTSVPPYCGAPLQEVTSHGVIRSPGSPGNYPNNRLRPRLSRSGWYLQCWSLISAQFLIREWNAELFLSGTEETDPVFAKFCNTSHPAPLFSSGPEVTVHFHTDAKKNLPGFQLTYSVVNAMPGCGGVYTRERDEIRSPSFNGGYPNDVKCEYKIQLEDQARIKLTFESFSLETGDKCQFDYLEIHDGATSDSPLLGRYCGGTVPAPFTSERNTLLLIFSTDWATSDGGFLIKYEAVCGGKYTEPNGLIQSPNYPNKYSHNRECIYEIVQPLGKIIKLSFLDFDIESNSSPGCVYDYVEIRDGHNSNSTLVGKYCAKRPPFVVSSFNYLWIKFGTDATNSERGFQANYTTAELDCGGITKENPGSIKSPKYPEIYPVGTKCTWIIAAPPGNIIQIIWHNFQLESSYECNYDYVEVFDNNTDTGLGQSIGRFCGQKSPPILLSTSNLVTIGFRSDNSFSLGGFSLTYSFLLEQNVCGGNYYTSFGTIRSPNYPNQYPRNKECSWVIEVPPGHQILLNVTDFSLERYMVCRYDFLAIHNGGSAASPLLGKFCGTDIPKFIPSHANKLFIYFKSDMTKTEKGFQITWEATATGCGGNLTGPKGAIISPNYPEPYAVNTECVWTMGTSVGSNIQLIFSDFDLEEHSACMLDYVEVFDGPSMSYKSLGRFCTTHPPYLRSSTNILTVKFRSDLSWNGRGFKLQYSTLCNNTLTGFGGVLESPNFPNAYPNYVNCNWEIKVAEGNKINISFSHFDLEPLLSTLNSTSYIYDYVEISYASESGEEEISFEKYGTYTGVELPPPITINSNHAKVHFVADHLISSTGFRLEWQLYGCGEILMKPSGTISSPNYPEAYPPGIQCNWKIEVEYGSQIEITFEKVDVEKVFDCYLDGITLFNGEDETSPKIATICYQTQPITLRSTGNFMFVQFQADQSIQGKGFRASYVTKPTKCGGKYVSSSGSITSPNYPNNYDVNDTCEYSIEVEDGHIVELAIVDFDLYAPETNCSSNNNSYVKIYDFIESNRILCPVLAKICGKEQWNTTIQSTSNKVLVHMVTETRVVSKGFHIRYKQACGAKIVTDGTGTIHYDPSQSDYMQQNCSWTILAKDPTKHVYLTITHLDTMVSYSEEDEKNKLLTIYNGQSTDAPLLGRYSGLKMPPTIASDGNALHIVLDSNLLIFGTYSVVDSTCGQTLTSLDGYFASPGYPKQYPMDTACEWTLDVTEGNHVTLTFPAFELLESDNCNTDFLEIRQKNSTGKLLGTFCGKNVPTNITNQGSLWIYLKTSAIEGDLTSVTAKGFLADYALVTNNELSGASGRIVSPHYNQELPIHGDFSWTITVDFGKRILLTFTELYLDNAGDDVCYSTITVYDGPDDDSTNLGEYCTGFNKTVKSTSNVIHIKFFAYRVGSTRSLKRFIIDWLQVESVEIKVQGPSNITGCGSTEVIDINKQKNYTLIRSPGFPHGYASNLFCEWIISTIPMNHFKIFFPVLDLQKYFGSICYADYVEVWEKKPNADWSSVKKLCHENTTGLTINIYSNLMKLTFKTDRVFNGTGFATYIRETCGGSLTDPSGYIVFDNNTRYGYGNPFRILCEWNITVPAGRTIEIKFLELDIHQNDDCKNFLIVRNGILPESPILQKICGNTQLVTLETTGNTAFVKYAGLSAIANFKIQYQDVVYSCGNDVLSLNKFSNVTEISTPNYPNVPPPHIECIWRFMAPPGETLRIDFIDRFDLVTYADCTKEYVEIRNGGTQLSKLIGRYCSMPDSQFTTDNMIYIKYFTDVSEPNNGFKARISIGKCGGTIRGKSGTLQSPFYNNINKFPIGVNCTWQLIVPPDHTMSIVFKAIDLEDSNSCMNVDHVFVVEPKVADSGRTILGTFCGKKVPAVLKSSSNQVIISFQTSQRKQLLKGFMLQFNSSIEECGGNINTPSGVIQSPNYPGPMTSTRKCLWIITVPRGRRITLTIKDLDIDERLKNAYLSGFSVYNAPHFLGYITLKLVNNERVLESTDNQMVVFHWATASNSRGFKAEFSSNNPTACVGDFNQDSGVLSQPKLGQTYFCTYIRDSVSKSDNSTLVLDIKTVTNFTLQQKTSCKSQSGYLAISTNEKTILNKICVPSVRTLCLPYSQLKIKAIQIFSRNQINYTVSYHTHPCGGVVKAGSGFIQSPGYPNKYSSTVQCAWLITMPVGQTMYLTFEELDLDNNCENHFVDVYNGGSSDSPKIDRYCQKNKPKVITTQTNNVLIEYKFDQSSTGKGFKLRYEPKTEGCGGVLHDAKPVIQTPAYPSDYQNNAECLWELRAPSGFHIGLTFTSRFQIEESTDCQNDFVEVLDWKDEQWVSLGKKCGRELPPIFNSTGNKMQILFRSNEKIDGQGFQAKWEWNCGGTFIAGKMEQFIVSPGYPMEYKPYMNCQYKITAPSSRFINIKFYDFHLEGMGSNCKYDNLSISNSIVSKWALSNGLHRYMFCGTRSPPAIRLNNVVYIHFKTDGYVQHTGFKFSYYLDDCGGNITTPTVISTPDMNQARTIGLFNGYLTCTWNIRAPIGKIVVAKFQEFNLQFRRNCYFDNVEMYDGTIIKFGDKLATLCGNLNDDLPTIKSTNNTMVMSLRTDRTLNHTGVTAEIFFVYGPQAGCGGTLDVKKPTTLTAPNLEDLDCTWVVSSASGTYLKAELTEVNLPCKDCVLEVRDGTQVNSDLIERFSNISSTSLKQILTSSRNAISIRLATNGIVNRGFSLILTAESSPCGTTYLNVSTNIQSLASPSYPMLYPSNIRCTWMLKGTTNFMLRFLDFDMTEDRNETIASNICAEDRLQIMENAGRAHYMFPINQNSDVPLIVGKKKSQAEFSRYALNLGTYQFCGKSLKPFDFYTNVPSVTIQFWSSNKQQGKGRGFKLEYHTIGCNRNFTDLQGRIIYSTNTNCHQVIKVPTNYTIALYFQSFFFQIAPNCSKAGVEILDGVSSPKVLAELCGVTLPNSIFSKTNQITLRSWRDTNALVGTYDILYTATDKGQGCGGSFYNYKGRFTSPLHPLGYQSTVPCVWNVQVPTGSRVGLKFSVFNIQGDCERNSVSVTTYTGDRTTTLILCKDDNPGVFYSDSRITVSYQSSGENGGTGWMALFEAVN